VKAREIPRRLGSPVWIYSQARDVVLRLRYGAAATDFARDYRAVRPFSMAGPARLRALHDAVGGVIARGIAGDVVECGTAHGGSAALMGLALARAKAARTLWAFDTFEGIPPATEADPDFAIARLYTGDFRGEQAEVEALLARLGVLERTRLVKGLFQETVPAAPVGAIAVLHLDGDWYESVKVCLDHLYDRVSPGGVIQIDDYGHWEGARKAVDEFLARRRLTPRLRWIDYTGRQWIKA
jgi:predicted O-methyltransferase YrrM